MVSKYPEAFKKRRLKPQAKVMEKHPPLKQTEQKKKDFEQEFEKQLKT